MRATLDLPRALVFAFIAAVFAFGAARVHAQDEAMVLPVEPERLVVATAMGDRSFTIEIADDPDERARGLMFREQMDGDHGMLFVFEDTRHVGFWMHNTPLPLDLVFISEGGEVRAIKRGIPFSREPIDPGEPVRFVLELNAGAAAGAGMARGDRVRHPRIDAIAGGG